MQYPEVLDEIMTIEKMLQKKYRGMARFGDGDFNLIRGGTDRFHKPSPQLAHALATCLHRGSNRVLNCLIPPPTLEKHGTLRYQRWVNYVEMNAGIFPFLSDELYGSSNISRMDSNPSLHTIAWWHQVSKLWKDKDICLVMGSERSLTKKKLFESPHAPLSVTEVWCKPRDNFEESDRIYADVLKANKEIVVLCSGLTTRPLVHRLVEAGHLAYDLGHFGQWFNKGCPIPLADCPK